MVLSKIKPYTEYIEYLPIAVIFTLFISNADHMKFHIKRNCYNSLILITSLIVLYGLLTIDGLKPYQAIVIVTLLFFSMIYLKRQYHTKPI